MTVGIVRATLDNIEQSMRELLQLIDYQPRREAFFIKPNVAAPARPGRGVYTDPAVVDAFLSCFPGKPAVIGEGCVVGIHADMVFHDTGYGAVAERHGAALVDLEGTERFDAEWPLGRLRLPTYLHTHEYINVAKMKTHIQTGVSLGLKNQKGLLLGVDKRRFHRLGLNEHIRSLATVVQPHLTIVDGIVGLEGDGPWGYGQPVQMNVLVAGTDVFEVDNVCLQLMGFAPEHAPHIPALSEVKTVGLSITEARRQLAFGYAGSLRYRNMYQHVGDSCSGCNLALYYGLRAIKHSRWRRLKFAYRGGWRRLDIVMGQADRLPPEHGKVVCLGDCTRHLAEEHGLPLARGCPPTPEEVLKIL